MKSIEIRIEEQADYIEGIKASDRSPERKAELLHSAYAVMERLLDEQIGNINKSEDDPARVTHQVTSAQQSSQRSHSW